MGILDNLRFPNLSRKNHDFWIRMQELETIEPTQIMASANIKQEEIKAKALIDKAKVDAKTQEQRNQVELWMKMMDIQSENYRLLLKYQHHMNLHLTQANQELFRSAIDRNNTAYENVLKMLAKAYDDGNLDIIPSFMTILLHHSESSNALVQSLANVISQAQQQQSLPSEDLQIIHSLEFSGVIPTHTLGKNTAALL